MVIVSPGTNVTVDCVAGRATGATCWGGFFRRLRRLSRTSSSPITTRTIPPMRRMFGTVVSANVFSDFASLTVCTTSATDSGVWENLFSTTLIGCCGQLVQAGHPLDGGRHVRVAGQHLSQLGQDLGIGRRVHRLHHVAHLHDASRGGLHRVRSGERHQIAQLDGLGGEGDEGGGVLRRQVRQERRQEHVDVETGLLQDGLQLVERELAGQRRELVERREVGGADRQRRGLVAGEVDDRETADLAVALRVRRVGGGDLVLVDGGRLRRCVERERQPVGGAAVDDVVRAERPGPVDP